MAKRSAKDEKHGHVPGGWVLLSRGLRDSEVWSWDSDHVRLWVYLLLSVNARAEQSRVIDGIEIGYGQVLKSYRRIADENEYAANNQLTKWNPSRVKRMLDRFRDAGMIVVLETRLGTLITVRNFKRYQDFDSYRTESGTEVGTGSKRDRNDNNSSIQLDLTPVPPACDEVAKLWEVWLEVLGGPPPLPELSTGRRREVLSLLLAEQLERRAAAAATEPTDVFRKICEAVKVSSHHMATRAYQFPESLFRNEERRERWTLAALTGRPDRERTYSRAPRTEL